MKFNDLFSRRTKRRIWSSSPDVAGQLLHLARKRQLGIPERTPAWADLGAIAAFYQEAKHVEQVTGDQRLRWSER